MSPARYLMRRRKKTHVTPEPESPVAALARVVDGAALAANQAHKPQRPRRSLARRSLARRSVRMAGLFTGVTLGFLALLLGVLAIRLAMGPIAIEGLSQRVASAMNRQIGKDWSTRIRAATIDHAGLNPALTLEGVEVFTPDGQRVLFAPSATVAVDPWSLALGQFRPRAIAFRGLALRVAMSADGNISFVAGSEGDVPAVAPATGATDPQQATAASSTGAPRQLTQTLARSAASAIELLTSSDGFLGGIDNASVTGARVILIGADGSQRFKFSDADLLFSRPKDNLRQFSFELTGGKGRWRLDGAISGRSTEKRVANVTFQNVPVSDLLAFSPREKPVWTDMALSGAIVGSVGSGGALSELTTHINGAKAVIHTDDPDMPQFTMDALAVETAWRPGPARFDITRLFASWDGYHVNASGALGPGVDGSPWRLDLGSTDALAAPFAPGDTPTPITRLTARLSGAPEGGARIDQFDVATQRGAVSVTGQLGGPAAADGVTLTISGAGAETRAALALWPSFAAKQVRDYIGRTFSAGVVDRFNVQVRMSRDAILAAREKKPMRAEELAVDVVMSGGVWRATPGMPPVIASATATATGVAARIAVKDARMKPETGAALQIPTAEVVILSALRPTPRADVSFRIDGEVPALLRVMTKAGLGAAPVEPARIKGQAQLNVALAIPLTAHTKASDIQPKITGTLADVTLEHAMGEHRLEAGAFQLAVDESQSTLKGDARLAGVPVTIDMRQPRQGKTAGEINVSAVLDEAARARLNMNIGSAISGPVTVSARLPLPESGAAQANSAASPQKIDIDLTRARINEVIPGWTKAAGKAGKLSFALEEQRGGIRLSDLTLDAGNVSAARGVAELDAKGGLQRLRLGSFRMSPSDNMRVDIDRADDIYKVTVRGQLIDARPMLRAIVTDDGGKRGAGGSASGTGQATGQTAGAPKIDLDLSSTILAGFNDESLTNASLKLTSRNGQVRSAAMDGRFGQATASLRLASQGANAESLEIRSGNAGALLRFADLYRRMYGGDLVISAALGRRSQSGAIDIARFVLRDEPALGRIVAAQPATSGANRINVSEVPFQRLQGQFDRKGGRVQLRDGIIWGPQVGIKLDGTVDFANDRTDLTGTFIPAYALNNAFARIPIVGPLIGGGANEGLFAVSFRITGPASGPTLTVNPLTAVAPGIFRKFLEVFTPDGSGNNQPLAPPTPPSRIP